MAKSLTFQKSGGNLLSYDEKDIRANQWLVGTFADYDVFAPVYDPADGNIYINTTGVFATTAPSSDSTNWLLLPAGEHAATVVVTDTNGVINIAVTGTGGNVTNTSFDAGHIFQNESGSALDYRETLQIKGDTTFAIKDADTVELDLEQIDTNKITVDKFTLGSSAAITGDDSDIDLDNISINKTNADASKVITDNITLSSAISLDDVKALEGFITLNEMIDLDIINDQMAAIIKALGRSDEGFTSQVFSIPSPVSSWTTANFTTRGDVNISSTGVITQPSNTSWVYGVAGELYIKPPLGYHTQTATVNGNSFLYITIGISLSKIRHASYIDDLVAIKDYDGTDDTIPNPDNIFFKNYAGHQFTASKDHSDESTDGITVFEYTASDARQRLFTITLPILASVDDRYDSQDKFEIQTDKGLNAFFFHSGSDSVITAGLKAGIAANAAAIDILEAHTDRYPDETDINDAAVGQIISKAEVIEPGEVSFMSFDTEPQGTPGVDALLLVVNYPKHSPLTTFTGINVPINTTGLDADGIASALVTSFNTDTNDADLVAFRTGYVGTDGVTYGGYTATSSGATFTITSDNVGSVYNAEVNVYTMAASFRELNLKPFEHGTGGPRAILQFKDLPASTPAEISTSAELVTFRGSGYVKGDQFVVTGAAVEAPQSVAVAAQMNIIFPDVPANANLNEVSNVFTDESFFTIVSGDAPSRLFFGSFAAQLGVPFLDQNNSTQLLFRAQTATPNVGSTWATDALGILDDIIATGATGLQASGRGTTGTAAFVSANCSGVILGGGGEGDRTLVITADTPGATGGTLGTATAGGFTNTYVQGADAMVASLDQYNLYQVLTSTSIMNLTDGTLITVL